MNAKLGHMSRWQIGSKLITWIRESMLHRTIVNITARIMRELKLCIEITRDSRTPTISKILLWIAIGYAVSPIGLVPDFIPIVGYLDDAIIVPLLIIFAMRRVSPEVVAECRLKVASTLPKSLPNPEQVRYRTRYEICFGITE